MALDLKAIIEAAQTAYFANVGYDTAGNGAGSVSQAVLFIGACRTLIALMPKMATQDRGSLSLSPDLVRDELVQARRWMALSPAAAGGGGNRSFSMENFRGAPTQPGTLNPDPGGSP